MFKYILSLFLCFSFTLIYSQEKEVCIERFNSLENTSIDSKEDLIKHYSALDCLLVICQHENIEWIDKTILAAKEYKDSLVNQPFVWSYYLHLYRAERHEEKQVLATELISYAEENKFNISGDFYIEAGLNYLRIGDFANELNAYKKGSACYERDHSPNLIYAQSSIANFYQNLEDYEKALPYQEEAYQTALGLSPDNIKYYTTTNILSSIANIYFELKDPKKANEYFNRALADSKFQLNKDLSLGVRSDYIEFLLQTNQIEKASLQITEAEEFIERPEIKNVLKKEALSYYKLIRSMHALETKQFNKLIHPDTLLKVNHNLENRGTISNYAIDFYKQSNQMDKALEASIKNTTLIKEEAKKQKVSATALILEQQKTVELQNENIRLKASREKRKIIIIVLLGFLLLIGSLLYLVSKSNQRIKGLNHLIGEKNKKIITQLKELEQISYVMTHDLKEPANTVNGFSNLLQSNHETEFSSKSLSYLDIIKKSSKSMLQSIQMLHNFLVLGQTNKIESSDLNIVFKNAQINLSGIIENTQAVIHSENLPTLNCYPKELELAFQNLLSNAMKYSKPDVTPKINLTVKEQKEEYEFRLTDNGIGISEENQSKIFDLFQRLHNQSDIEGSGIGLANVRKIINIHKGVIMVTSQINEGSTFYFTINKKLS